MCIRDSSYGNLVMNGSFESGSFANWILSGNTTYYQIVPPGGYVNTGAPPPGSTYFGEFGPDYPPIVVSQTIPTAIGQDYTFSFYVTTFDTVSYTHLDVYKRQTIGRRDFVTVGDTRNHPREDRIGVAESTTHTNRRHGKNLGNNV